MATTTIVWSGLSEMIANCEAIKSRMVATMASEGESFGEDWENWSKANHPWTNRTRVAQDSLKVDVDASESGLVLTHHNESFHGNGLEIWRGGKWGVIPKSFAANLGSAKAMMDRIVQSGMGG